IIHRDLACRNVLVDADGAAKLTDFGLSRVLDRANSEAQTQSTFGPIRWLPPEFLTDAVYSKAGDVYMFGMFLLELLTEQFPYAGVDNLLDVAAM
ncbi:PREDICTED: tyrosine-protein kinase isoform SRK1-like, partial [Priapulus caudatus]|uniref:Tyrosine-protein kinase isoform SRK1-like n=1 Tax=Priapulus caudatus TaxID=37621 RepID=A0ABM1F855_PRICU